MIARGFRSLLWVAAAGFAAFCCYLLSLQVAAERGELARLDQRIHHAREKIRALQTELGTRGRLQQLEEWNADVLALSAPSAHQFIDSAVRLASFDARTPALADGGAEVRLAAADATPNVPTAQPGPLAPAASPVRLAVATAPTPAAIADRPMVHRASFDLMPDAPSPPPPRPARATASQDRPAERASGALLDQDTLRAITRAARAEQRGGARD